GPERPALTTDPGLPALTGESEAAPGFQLPPGSPEPVPVPVPVATTPVSVQPPSPAPPSPSQPSPAPALADIGSVLESLRDDAAAQAPPPPAARSTPPERRPARPSPPPPPHPRRHWVQLGIGQNQALLATDFRRHLEAAPAQLRGRTPWVARLNATNRLLVGPFATPAEAQRFVNTLRGAGVTAYSWTSDPGEVVERLTTRR
ncbi:MAG: SPOR domain-containing protein, partial [Sphingosinicella sp.]